MHMSDALLSPAVGGVMWAAGGAAVALSARKVDAEPESRKIPLMGVLAAFVFAGQMVNFTIPGVGSSGHLGGGMILAVLLGPYAAFLAMASVLIVQALFFADGGLLAMGCNIVNLGFIPAFVAYPLLFCPLAGRNPSPGRLTAASLAAAVFGLQLGAVAVVLQTVLSGISDLPISSFLILMLPVHLAIGIVEGLVTAAVVGFVWRARPETLHPGPVEAPRNRLSFRTLAAAFALAALLAGGFLSLFSSPLPDGLEWALYKSTGGRPPSAPAGGVHGKLGALQEKTALLADYGLPGREGGGVESEGTASSADTGLAGVVGGVLTLLLALGFGVAVRKALPRRTA